MGNIESRVRQAEGLTEARNTSSRPELVVFFEEAGGGWHDHNGVSVDLDHYRSPAYKVTLFCLDPRGPQ